MLTEHDYPDRFCDCSTCADMCKHVPCRPLPEEVAAMPKDVQARLELCYACNGFDGLRAGTAIPGAYRGRCTFLTQDNKCELHKTCKPFEGRKVVCTRDYPEGHKDLDPYGADSSTRLYQIIEDAWATDEGQRVLAEWCAAYNESPSFSRSEQP